MKNNIIELDKVDVGLLFQDLNSGQKDFMNMLFIEGYTQQEVAKIKGMPLGTVKTQSRNLIKKLKTYSEFVIK